MSDDCKALFRRCQAYKELNRFDDALKDARRLVALDPKNKQFIDFIQSLNRTIQDKVNNFLSDYYTDFFKPV